ncbi:hypothetical protein HPB48_026012 [Haemaphysalis longicornis]|uniref:Uncharacterized protein n=1 Tax=Haemaphysalis longicornis TaxID=44386 RepID=A0A9J6HB84_HAELO|nr:hypothetical protein HPB48_026012 [Haemaphysalis longicornis]
MEKQLGAEAAGAADAAATVACSPENRAAAVSTQRVGATVKLVTVVEGEAISPHEHANSTGWLPYYRQAFGRAQQSQRATLPATSAPPQGTNDILIAFHRASPLRNKFRDFATSNKCAEVPTSPTSQG